MGEDTNEPDDEEDWEWQIAVARARASSNDLPRARRAPPPPPRAKSSTQPLGSGPRTIVPVPALPVVDPQLVRSYVRPRR